MGGPLSPLTWCMAFDPICWIAGMAAMCELLGYVDDLLALVFGPGHAMLIYLALLAATKAAGLVVEDHCCAWWVGSAGFDVAKELLAPFPTTVTPGPDGTDSFTITGGPVDVYVQLLRMAHALPDGCQLRRCSRPCRCKAKHLLVPACRIGDWAASLDGTPLAAACAPGGRFLGAYLHGRVRPHDAIPDSDVATPEAINVGTLATYGRAVSSCTERVSAILAAGLSLANRASSWNVHGVSTLAYPASICCVSQQIERTLNEGIERLFPTGRWAAAMLPCDLGTLLGLKGAPRAPGLVCSVGSFAAVLRGGLAGCPATRGQAEGLRDAAGAWAETYSHNAGQIGPLPKPGSLRTAARCLTRTLAGERRPGSGNAAYLAFWHLQDAGHTLQYLTGRSQLRRWLPTSGHEWGTLAAAESWASAWLVTRLLLNGLPRGQVRGGTGHALRCWGCGANDAFRWRWIRGSHDHAPVGWCATCSASRTHGRPPDIEGPGAALPGPPCPERGGSAACPLCGLGEAGAEHLTVFCPAVANAWHNLRQPIGKWHIANLIGRERDDPALALRFMRGVAFLACALADKTPLSPDDGARAVVLQVVRARLPLGVHCPAPTVGQHGNWAVHDALSSWMGPWMLQDPDRPQCRHCPAIGTALAGTAPSRHRLIDAAAEGRPPPAGLSATASVACGAVIFRLRADTTPAVWARDEAGP